MSLEQLRIFVAVAERQHMTRAAEALNLTQQAVSAAVVALENAYRTALFHRVGRRIELTEAGRLFLEEARSVLNRAAAAELALSELGGLKRGTLAVQASQTIANYWLPRRLVSFHRAYPEIALRVASAIPRRSPGPSWMRRQSLASLKARSMNPPVRASRSARTGWSLSSLRGIPGRGAIASSCTNWRSPNGCCARRARAPARRSNRLSSSLASR